MPFCHAPWTNIDISPQGKISPCCKFRHEYHDAPLRYDTASLDDYLTSATLIKIKQDFQNGIWPQGCERCRIEEENGIESKRQLDYQRWKPLYDNHQPDTDGFITASIAFGNTCNLKCITCGPESSSLWHKEYREIYGIDVQSNHFYKTDFLDQLLSRMPNLRHLDIPGGEPFISGVPQQKRLLRTWVDQGQAKHISLHYTTNATMFPDQDWWSLWAHFANVDLQISIDGIADRFEYIRYPARWLEVQKNVDRYLERWQGNTQISVSHTVSVFNTYYLDEFFSWCAQKGLPRPWLGRVHNPQHMRPTVWPESARSLLVEHLESSRFDDAKTWASLLRNQDDSKYFQDFVRAVERHDQYRGTLFARTFPELASWIKK
jgi:MoaA/NifB/PqqE/SkfB family radical SAM enzyme